MTIKLFNPGSSNSVATAITADVTYRVGPGETFAEPGDFMDWMLSRRIARGVTVTVHVTTGTYRLTKTVRGHPDGGQIAWTNDGLVGSALTGADFSQFDQAGDIDSVLGVDTTVRATNRAADEVVVRAAYKVIFEVDSTLAAGLAACNMNGGDWINAPTLWIAVNDVGAEYPGIGCLTGTSLSNTFEDGPGGVLNVPGSCFFGFDNCNMLCDGGGTINGNGSITAYSGQDNSRTDFQGLMNCQDMISIGGVQFGYRANHGGEAWIDGFYARGNTTGVEIDNSTGMCRLSGCDIQFNYIGYSSSDGGSTKANFEATFLGLSTTTAGTGTTATVTFASSVDVGVGKPMTLIGIQPSAYNGQTVTTASAPGSVSYASTATGSMSVAGNVFLLLPPAIKNNARAQIIVTNGGSATVRLVDMVTTATFPQNGVAAQQPIYGVNINVSGSVTVDTGSISGHQRNGFLTGGDLSAVGCTLTNIQGDSGIVLQPNASSIYTTKRTKYRPVTGKSADFTVAAYEENFTLSKSSACVVTLPAASSSSGRYLSFLNYTAQPLDAASAVVITRTGGVATTSILGATTGAWAEMQSDGGIHWVILRSG